MAKLWLKLDSQLGEIRVFVKRKLKGGASGLYYPERGEMFIQEADTIGMKMTLFHEILHGALQPYSGHVRDQLLGTKSVKREELIVGMFEPTLFDLLNRNALLAIPDPPKLKRRRKDKREKNRTRGR